MTNQLARFWLCMLAASLIVSCSGDGGHGGSSASAVIKGTVLDSLDEPLTDAAVQSQDEASTQTGADGAFELQTGIGPKHLTISKDDVVIEHCLIVAERVIYDVGTITPSTPTNCDIVCTASADSDDRDCDEVSNDVEAAGWDTTITLGDGTSETRHVASDPGLRDTDGDGLTDGEEYAARMDAARADTDGDMLSDYAEFNVYKSNPLMVDTDGDSKGPNEDKPSDPNLWDGNEVLVSHTSPVLADTDGDGKKDYEEIHSGGTSPLIADLPVLALEVYGDPLLSLPNAHVAEGCEQTSTNLTREAQEHVNTDNVTTKMSIENTVKLHTETEAGTSTWPPSFSAKLTSDTEFKQGYIHETTANFTQTSVQDNQNKVTCWENASSDFSNGEVSVAMKLHNRSSLSFKVKKIRVIAYQLTTGSNFRLIGSLDPEGWNEEGEVLGPYGDITMTVKTTGIDAPTMKSLIANSSALMFEVGAYELFQLDDAGVNETVNYAKLGESVVQQTGLLTIDYGDGNIERHMVATNVNRNPDGSARGVTLEEALNDVLKISYETETQRDSAGNVIGRKVLKQVKTTATYQNDAEQAGRGFWVVGGNGDAFAVGISTNFDDIVLKSGERISLVFLRDTDLDSLFDNEEQLLGSETTNQDTDSDGLSDYDEAKVGWDVNLQETSYHINPDPRFADVDGDYLSDSAEKILGTDPYSKNTDKDDLDDTNDEYPLTAPCLAGNELGIAGWWSGTLASPGSTTVLDQWTSPPVTEEHTSLGDPFGYASNGELTGNLLLRAWKPDYITTSGENAVFGFNTSAPEQHDQQLTIDDDAASDLRRSISPSAQFTVSAWVYWNGNATGAEWGTVLTKGMPGTETYGVYVKADGALGFALYRQAHQKRWNWLGDSACEDYDPALREWTQTAASVLPQQTWVHVTVTFGNEIMRIYVNDKKEAEYTVNPQVDQGTCWSRSDTSYLIANSDPLRIGLDREPTSSIWPFRGMMDEVQVFGQQMTPTEVEIFHQIGICAP